MVAIDSRKLVNLAFSKSITAMCVRGAVDNQECFGGTMLEQNVKV